ncbi:MAG: methionyl-tRNA formyltransferase [Patescibacteria group bacterium]
MKYVFFGTPEFAEVILEKLIENGIPPSLVVCNPDKPAGRKKIITPPLVKILAEKNNIKVYQPEKLEVKSFKKEIGESGFAVVAAYGKIIPKNIIDLFPQGIIGVHPSLLPKYRGASPIQTAILNNEEQTGVTFYLLDEKTDHGKVLAQQALYEPIDQIYYEELLKNLASLAGEMLAGFLPDFVKGEIAPQAQDETQATQTKKFTTDDGRVDLGKDDPEVVWRKVRALNPEPGVFTLSPSKGGLRRMKILEADFFPAVAGGKLKLKKIQFEGKKPQDL